MNIKKLKLNNTLNALGYHQNLFDPNFDLKNIVLIMR